MVGANQIIYNKKGVTWCCEVIALLRINMADTSPNVNAGTESGHSGASTDPGPSHRNTEQQVFRL